MKKGLLSIKIMFALIFVLSPTYTAAYEAVNFHEILQGGRNGSNMGILSTEYIQDGEILLENLQNNMLRINASTKSHSNVSIIGVQLYLQRINESGNWVNISNLGDYSSNNASTFNKNLNISISKGYYYRVYGVHYITHNGNSEYKYSYSNQLYIN